MNILTLSTKTRIYLFSGIIATLSLGVAIYFTSVARADTSLLFGQKHAYSATVRPDGKVITYGKVVLNNPDDSPVKETTFTVPKGVEISNLSIYQILVPERCAKEKPATTEAQQQEPLIAPDYPRYETPCEYVEQHAFELNEYDTYGYRGSDDSRLRYSAIKPAQNGNTFTLTLPEPIQPQKRGAYIVAYMVNKGYVNDTLGLYSLQFKTLQVPQAIEEVRVSVDVSSDLYTKVKRSTIQPATEDSLSLTSGASAGADQAVESRNLDKLQSSVGTGGTFTKTGKNLTPNETFVVSGEFADAIWKLYLWWIIGTLVGGILIVVLIIFLLKKADQQSTPKKKGKK